jgi:hypothetical protein
MSRKCGGTVYPKQYNEDVDCGASPPPQELRMGKQNSCPGFGLARDDTVGLGRVNLPTDLPAEVLLCPSIAPGEGGT